MKNKYLILLVCIMMILSSCAVVMASDQTLQQGSSIEQVKHLHLSHTNNVIGGVCGGLGEYFNVDPTLFRVAFVGSVFLEGCGLVIYLLLWALMPNN